MAGDNQRVGLDREQRAVLRRINSIGRQRGATPIERKAAVEIGLVESELRNLPGGDADSAGWRQERQSIYRDPTNLDASIGRVFDEMRAQRGRYGSAGALAAAVQRPAAQYRGRYQERSAEADRLLGMAGGGSSTTSSPGVDATPAAAQAGVDGSAGQELAALMAAAVAPAQPRSSMGLATPAFAAAPVLPEGAQMVASQAPAQESPGAALQDALTAIKAIKGPELPAQAQSPGGGLQAPSGGVSGRYPVARRGKLIGTPGAGTHTLGNWQSDNAVDLAVPVGTPIYALEDGVVAKTVDRPSGGGRFAGGQITLRGKNNSYFYGHTSKLGVRPGERVRKGQVIGRTGSANGVAHLHLGVERGDPRRIIGQGR